MDRHPRVALTASIRLWTLLTAATLAAVFLWQPARCMAQPPAPVEDLWAFPEGTVAFIAFDPRYLGESAAKDPTRALVEAGVRAALSRIVEIEGEGSSVPDALLDPRALGAAPYRACILELAGTRGPERPLRMDRFAAILDVRLPGPAQDQFLGVLRGAANRDAARRGAASETSLPLPGGRRGTVLTRDGDAEWREVSWVQTAGSVIVGFGHGALERWFNTPPLKASALPEWHAHRTDVVKRRGATWPILEIMVDASALRRSIPEEFAFGRLGKLLDAWHLANAREIMLHVRRPVPPKSAEDARPPSNLLLVDLSYSSRADKPPRCSSLALSQAQWPAELTPTNAPYAAVFGADWLTWVDLAQDSWIACSQHAGLEASAARGRWMRAHEAALKRSAERSGPFVVLNGPAEAVPTLTVQLKAGPVERAVADLRELFAPFAGNVRFDALAKRWTLQLLREDAEPPLNTFTWQINRDGGMLTGAWDAAALPAQKPGK